MKLITKSRDEREREREKGQSTVHDNFIFPTVHCTNISIGRALSYYVTLYTLSAISPMSLIRPFPPSFGSFLNLNSITPDLYSLFPMNIQTWHNHHHHPPYPHRLSGHPKNWINIPRKTGYPSSSSLFYITTVVLYTSCFERKIWSRDKPPRDWIIFSNTSKTFDVSASCRYFPSSTTWLIINGFSHWNSLIMFKKSY